MESEQGERERENMKLSLTREMTNVVQCSRVEGRLSNFSEFGDQARNFLLNPFDCGVIFRV